MLSSKFPLTQFGSTLSVVFILGLAGGLTGGINASFAAEEEQDEVSADIPLERIYVIGSRARQKEIPGANTFVGKEELEKYEYSDINRILRQVAGVNIQEEDGFGLRPNIGIRGTGVERSERITLMEDGVLISPAPYAAPAAYYFPTAGRMQAVEVRKGSSSIKFGPRTTGGAINLVSTPIPSDMVASGKIKFGSFNQVESHAFAGVTKGQLGVLVETYQGSSDGFKTLPNGGDTGYRLEDYVAKFRYTSDPNSGVSQHIEFKVGLTDQRSNETYLGLTDADFAIDPNQRYAASQLDQFNSKHKQFQATHFVELGDNIDLTTVGYYNSFERDWFKLGGVDFGDGRGPVSPSTLFKDVTDPLNIAGLAIIRGAVDSIDDALKVKHNAREYYSWGVQTTMGSTFSIGETAHEVEFGVRYHVDQEDRLQNSENFRMEAGNMVQTSVDAIGTQGNRIAEAKAFAVFIQDEILVSGFRIVPGLRFEHIKTNRFDWAGSDPTRALAPTGTRENTIDVLIPGIGFSYDVTDDLSLLAGVHKGFTPPGPSNNNAVEESSWNYEVGGRYDGEVVFGEIVGFYNDYSNLLGTCSNATGCQTGDIGDQFNGGSVKVTGLEVSAGADVDISNDITMPIRFNYTFTSAKFQTSFDDGFWGDVMAGDELPYIPRQQLNVSVGVEWNKLSANVSLNYVGATRTSAGQGTMAINQKVAGRTATDISVQYTHNDNVRFFANVDNLFDKAYMVSRRPYGVRPGKPQSFSLGVHVTY